MAYGSGFGLLLSQTSQKRKMSYMGNELYLHLKTSNLQVRSRAPDMSMCFQHLRLTLTDCRGNHRRKQNLKNPNLQMSMNRAHLTSSPFNIQFVTISVSKRREQHRRKHFENQEPCIMRGVYYKNMKWQAAIKVDKKQIHPGTVGSQQEAACLAAFMCGREPNFELTAKEKDKLNKLIWDDFLTMTQNHDFSKFWKLMEKEYRS
ncbi:putative transcription factor AP2-EREBP family [Helianthus debilis subsp. tardiflorus]